MMSHDNQKESIKTAIRKDSTTLDDPTSELDTETNGTMSPKIKARLARNLFQKRAARQLQPCKLQLLMLIFDLFCREKSKYGQGIGCAQVYAGYAIDEG